MTVFRGKKESDWKLPKTELMNYFQMMKIWAMYGEMWLLHPYLNNCIVCCVSDIMKAQRKMCLILLRRGAGESHVNRWLWLKWGKCVWSLTHSLKCLSFCQPPVSSLKRVMFEVGVSEKQLELQATKEREHWRHSIPQVLCDLKSSVISPTAEWER